MGVEGTVENAMDYSKLFEKLDTNKDGRIDIKELSQALKGRGLIAEEAKKFLERSDSDKDAQLDLAEFTEYMSSHEKKLRLAFENLDRNKDGTIDAEEIIKSFQELGVKLGKAEAEDLLKRIDKDQTLNIDWEEWREFLLFQPGANIKDILHYWRHSTILDIGENATIPDDFTEKEMKTGLWWRQLVAGGLAGAVSRTATAPLDRLKILLQVHGSKSNNLSIASGFKQMLEEGGVKSLWRGNGMNVVKIAPESALKFMAYEQIKAFVRGRSNKKEIGVIERLCSGSLAGATSQTIIYPMEVMKTRMALRKTGQYNGMADCAMKILKNEGAKAFYRGYVPNILGIIPYAGIDLAVYETLKTYYIKRNQNSDPNILVLLACGTTSSTCGQFASYPLALVRTRLQAQAAGGSEASKDTMASMFSKILREDGPRGLYRGITPNFLKVAPAVSISYVVYEKSRQYLGINPK